MPVWPHPEVNVVDHALQLHSRRIGCESDLISAASAPATWSLIGDHTDHAGGVVLTSLSDLRTAVAISPRGDDRVSVNFYQFTQTGELSELPPTTASLEDVTLWQSSLASSDGSAQAVPSAPENTEASRLAVLIYTMVHRQMLSRDSRGFDITVINQIPPHAGLGENEAMLVATALSLAGDYEEIDSAPVRAKFAEVCFQAAIAMGDRPVLRARFTTALRGATGQLNIIDYADGSITQAAHPIGDPTRTVALVVAPPTHSDRAQEVLRREKFIAEATKAFAAESLRMLPDAESRVIDWLRAVHEIKGPDDIPPIEEATQWLDFLTTETSAALELTQAVRSRRHADMFPLLCNSQANTEKLYGVTGADSALAQLCLVRGALSARSAAAGLSDAVVVLVERSRVENFAADASADGLTVVELLDGHVAAPALSTS
ncbi:galactokinase [Corynebacterium ulcerans]|uniref:galactokinase family protein n=1 Tax=Corynebacterium ulcerans TaxID=65058 RepID=UPI0006284F21|nr:galactokinase family protein [Corynebacterium ulcerans]KKO85939.1 galactokinase [Corynebacterium ulcerans]KKO87160.1 galactokinase [Corynebacterium ulcerans]BDV26391.1 galactokinase [Corynebacterium ulcerans]